MQLRRTCAFTKPRSRQRGMGATIILFTIALIVIVGAALAYATRGNPKSITTQSAKTQSGVVLKQSADYRDAYARFLFEGGVASTMTFNAVSPTVLDLFFPASQYGSYAPPPAQIMANSATPQWVYNNSVIVTGVGSTAADSIAYVPDVLLGVCTEINNQMYASPTIPVSSVVALANLATNGITLDATVSGRASGCFQTTDTKYVIYTTLGEA